jgi:hypothetical protein
LVENNNKETRLTPDQARARTSKNSKNPKNSKNSKNSKNPTNPTTLKTLKNNLKPETLNHPKPK